MWAKKMQVFGRATVGPVHKGKLRELAILYAHLNHNQSANPDTAGAADRLIANMTKRYGPHVVHDNKLTTCIFLTRIE
jgi:L-asparaginase II